MTNDLSQAAMDRLIGMRSVMLYLLVGLVGLVAGCADAPTDVVEAARGRVEALSLDDQAYAPQVYAAARDALGRLEAELQAQADGFALTRSYDLAADLAAEVEQAVDTFESAVEAEKNRLRSETERLASDARSVLDAVRPDIADLSDAEGADLRRNVERVEASLEAVTDDMQSGRLADAFAGAEAAVAAARDIGDTLAALAAPETVPDEDAVMRAVRGGFDLPRRAYADDQALAAGAYRVRLTDESAPVVDTEPLTATRWAEFVHEEDGTVVGRALATVILDAEIGEVTTGWVPRNQVRVDELIGGEYIRVWLNREGSNYLVHLPTTGQ